MITTKQIPKLALGVLASYALAMSAMAQSSPPVLNASTTFPSVNFDSPPPALSYDPAAELLEIQCTPIDLSLSPQSVNFIYGGDVQPSLTMTAIVDNNGNFVGGNGAGLDLTLAGVVTLSVNGTSTTYDGTLLTGTAQAFAYSYDAGSGDMLVGLRYVPTGGKLLQFFQCSTIAVNTTVASITSYGSTFDGSFAQAFTGGATGAIGVEDDIPPLLVNCPSDASVNLIPQGPDPAITGNYIYLLTYGPPTATDNCDTTPTVSCFPASGTLVSLAPGGSTNVVCYATDLAGNNAQCSFTAMAPIPNNPTTYGYTLSLPNCSLTTLQSNPQNGCAAVYTFSIPTPIATEIDQNGNPVLQNGQPVTVPLVQPVVVTATALAADGQTAIPLTLVNNNTEYTGTFPQTAANSVDTITWTATDGNGNTASSQCSVSVVDLNPPTILCQNQTVTFKPTYTSSVSTISSTFNCDAIPVGESIWFSSSIQTPCTYSSAFTLHVTQQTISLFVDGSSTAIVIPVPDAYVTIDPQNTAATTTFANGAWTTVTQPRVPGNTFMSGVAYAVTTVMPGCSSIWNCTLPFCHNPKPPKVPRTKAVWTGTFSVNAPGVVVNWQWAAATYKNGTGFGSAYTALGVKPDDSRNDTSYKDSYDAGTPENFKSSWVAGARGDSWTSPSDHYIGAETSTAKVNLGHGHSCTGPVDFALPKVLDNCNAPYSVICTPAPGSVLPLGANTINCVATDNGGRTSTCSFTVTVLAPLQVVFDYPACDNINDNTSIPDAGFTDFNCPDSPSTPIIVNLFSSGQHVYFQARLLDCSGNDVTACNANSVTVHLDVTEREGAFSDGTLITELLGNDTSNSNPGAVMIPCYGTFQYTLNTANYPAHSVNNNIFFRACGWVDYNAYPGVPVGMEDVLLQSR